MKTSNVISFIALLIMGIVTLVAALGMESVLKASTYLIVFAVVVIVMSVINFIVGLKENKKMFGITNIISIVLIVIILFVIRTATVKDNAIYPNLVNKNNFSTMMMFLTSLVQVILGIINSILAFTEKKK